MTVLDGVREWLESCPLLEGGELHIDFLPHEARAYSVDSIPCAGTLKKYLDGSSVRQYLFALSSREFLDESIAGGVANMEFYEGFSQWMEERSRLGPLPDMGEGRTARRAETVSSAYPVSSDGHGTARYQMQCRIIYYEEGER